MRSDDREFCISDVVFQRIDVKVRGGGQVGALEFGLVKQAAGQACFRKLDCCQV